MGPLTDVQIKNIQVLIEIGAKALSSDKSLKDSVAIQQSALHLSAILEEVLNPVSQPNEEL